MFIDCVVKTKQTGITLIEVLVTMLIMTVGLLGLAGLQTTSIKDNLDNARRSQVMWLVAELVERARANPKGVAAGDYNTTINTSGCGTVPAMQCSDSGFQNASGMCTPQQMARFDVWEVFCGRTELGIVANSVDTLQLTSMTSNCIGTCSDTSNFTVSIDWESLAVTNSRTLSNASIAVQKNQSISMTVRL